MKNLLVPEIITLKNLLNDAPLLFQNPDTKETEVVKVSFYTFLVGTVLKDPCFGANAVTVMHAIDIKDKVKNAAANTFVEIDNEAGDLLLTAIKKPALNFNPEVAIQLGPFLKSILDLEK
jgi:hypothetical protein